MIHNICNMAIRDLSDMYALSPVALGLQAYISGKSLMAMLQPLHIKIYGQILMCIYSSQIITDM